MGIMALVPLSPLSDKVSRLGDMAYPDGRAVASWKVV